MRRPGKGERSCRSQPLGSVVFLTGRNSKFTSIKRYFLSVLIYGLVRKQLNEALLVHNYKVICENAVKVELPACNLQHSVRRHLLSQRLQEHT